MHRSDEAVAGDNLENDLLAHHQLPLLQMSYLTWQMSDSREMETKYPEIPLQLKMGFLIIQIWFEPSLETHNTYTKKVCLTWQVQTMTFG